MTLTHFNAAGEAWMVDVSHKTDTQREAVAEGRIQMAPETIALVAAGSMAKGDVLGVARIAAIQAAKRTSDWIPLCHPLPLSKIEVQFDIEPLAICCRATVRTLGRTGVEMEALTAVSAGLLTIYDMCKAAQKSMVLTDIRLLQKTGGKSGDWQAEPSPKPAGTDEV